jgi:hypothetical protein
MIFDLIPTLEITEAQRQAGCVCALHVLNGERAVLEVAVRILADTPVNKGVALGVAQPLAATYPAAPKAFLEPLAMPAVLYACPLVGSGAPEVLHALSDGVRAKPVRYGAASS